MSKRNYRQRKHSSGDSSEEEDQKTSQTIQEILALQKMKKKPSGLSAAELALGSKDDPEDAQMSTSDPFKMKTGGMTDLKTIRKSDLSKAHVEEGIKQTFSKESHLRDEDEEMRKYVEERLAKKKGLKKQGDQAEEEDDKDEEKNAAAQKRPRLLDDILYELPDHLKRYQSKRNEDMLSNQMLCGIPEVDLGIDAKIKNIEETEAAKLRLLREAVEKKKNIEETLTARQNLVKDLAKGYVQHSYYRIDEVTRVTSEGKRRPKQQQQPIERMRTEPVVNVTGDTPHWQQQPQQSQQQPLINHHRPDTISATTESSSSSIKPSDKAIFDSFKRKYAARNNRR